MRPNTLYGKLATVLLVIFLFLVFLFVAVIQYSMEMYHHEVSQRLHRQLAETIVSSNEFFKDDKVNESAVSEVFHHAMEINPSIEVYLLDTKGTILSYSAPPGKVLRKRIDLEPLHQYLRHEGRLPLYGDDPRDYQREKTFSAAPIPDGDVLQGYLYVILGGERHDSILEKLRSSYNLRLTIWLFVAALLFSLFVALLSFRMLTRRLQGLTRAVEMFEGSKFSKKPNGYLSTIAGENGDEIDRLQTNLSQMADHMIDQMDQLKRAQKSLREMIANVSHDLRTPLTALGGYLETVMLKDEELTNTQRMRYLEIASSHRERLSKLIDELFELGKLDSAAMKINKETFPLGELVLDVAQKFELRADQNGIDITAEIPSSLPHVVADIGLIERVFDNLIDNAFRHTLKGGRILLTVRPDHDCVTITVSDTGHGIPEHDIPHIFDRHFQMKRSEKERSGRTGLGLAISKRIVELHGGYIDVQSKVGTGTQFMFQLPIAASNR